MTTSPKNPIVSLKNRSLVLTGSILIGLGVLAFILQLSGSHPERAWQAYLINFLLWSGVAQGAMLFSTVTHITKAKWTGPLSGLSEAFAAFFPVSFGLFLLLFLGKSHVFPWLHQDLHGKEIWLNVPFLFTRDCIGLLILYGLGFAYLYYALEPKVDPDHSTGQIRSFLLKRWSQSSRAPQHTQNRLTTISVLYILAFALVLSLIGYDLVMAADPHWISTLFGAYTFVKAFFIGLGALIILAAVIRLHQGSDSALTDAHFHDVGKLFFAFCLVWADFFYVQLVVIWYGNISEETAYVIERTMTAPWSVLAWSVFIVCFIAPFLILLNKSVKTKPKFMIVLCTVVIVGIWLEHLLLLGPALSHDVSSIPVSLIDALITLGFLGLLVFTLAFFLDLFPEVAPIKERTVK